MSNYLQLDTIDDQKIH